MQIAKHLKPLKKAERHADFRDFINTIAIKYNTKTAFILKNKKGRQVDYTYITFTDLKNDIDALACAFLSRGYQNKRIAIIGDNKYPWFVTYLTQLSIGGVIVPLDKGLSFQEFESSVNRSYSDVIVYDKNHAALIEQLKQSENCRAEAFICMDTEETGDDFFKTLVCEGLSMDHSVLETIAIDPDEMAIILFTSGTTSMAKAVMLSQNNVLSTVYDLALAEDVRPTDINMAFLPYHHTFGSGGQLVMLDAGAATAFCDGLKYIQKNLVEYKISVFVCVPLLIESIYKRIMTTAKKNGLEKKLAFGKKLSNILLFFKIDMRRKIFKTVLDQLGGDLRLVISGASAIEPETLIGFHTFGIETANGYGMTESSPVLSAENRDVQRIGSIGRSMPNVTLAIDEPNEEGIGEIIAKGPNVMLGYYENEAATRETIIDGWLHTGDLGYIDKDGFIFICGRKKNVIVLKNGKNVFPEEVELLVSELEYVEEVFLFGLPKKTDENDLTLYLKVVYNKEFFKDVEGGEAAVQKIVEADIEKINETLPTYKQVHKVIVSDQEMIKTTTGKVKRFEEIEVIKKSLNMN